MCACQQVSPLWHQPFFWKNRQTSPDWLGAGADNPMAEVGLEADNPMTEVGLGADKPMVEIGLGADKPTAEIGFGASPRTPKAFRIDTAEAPEPPTAAEPTVAPPPG